VDHVLFLLFCAIAGSSFILMKKAALSFGPLTIAGLRCLSAAVVLAGLWWWMSPPRLPDRRERPWLGQLAALGYAYPFAMMPWLVSRHGSGFIGMMVCFVPLITVLISMPILGVFPTRGQMAGVLGGLVCIGVILLDGAERSIPPAHLALALSVPLGFAYTNVITRKHLGELSPYLLTFLCVGAVCLLLTPVGLAVEPVDRGPDFAVAAGSLLTLGVISTAVGLVIFFRVLQRRGPLYAGMVTYLVPLGALLWGWADAERVTVLQVSALLGVLAMVALVQLDLARQSAKADGGAHGVRKGRSRADAFSGTAR
jgi:drug/metabolite transporter (DMT)-like permease